MGCDGGTIPKRDELVRTKRKPEQKDKTEDLIAKWKHCALSSNKLSPPIVSCELGRLYNKESIIEYLLDKESSPNGQLVKHIRSLRDLIELKLTEKNNSRSDDNKGAVGGEYVDVQDSRFICPVVGLEMNGVYKFCYLRSCGCVMSERALKEVKSDACHVCNKEFSQDDIIILNGNEHEIEDLTKRMQERREKAKEKKGKKRKGEAQQQCSSKKIETASTSGSSSSTNTKASANSILTEKAKKDYSVSRDPQASETYKSIFTTHESAKNKPKAHWVTFNPMYY